MYNKYQYKNYTFKLAITVFKNKIYKISFFWTKKIIKLKWPLFWFG